LLLLARSRAGSSMSRADQAALAAEARELYLQLVAHANLDASAPLTSNIRAGFSYIAEVLLRAGDRDGAFRAQQWSARSSVDDAAAIAAASRAEAANPEAAGRITERRRLIVERTAALRSVEAQLGNPREDFDSAAVNTRIAVLDQAIREVDAALAAGGVSLQRFTAAGLAEVQARLGAGEAFLHVSELGNAYAVTAMTGGRSFQYLAGESSAAITARVAALRRTLDGGAAGTAFDRADAAALYRALISPQLAGALRSARHLIVSANGALGALPFAVLVADEKGSGYLVDQLAVSRSPGIPAAARQQVLAPSPQLFAMGDVTGSGGKGAALAMRGGGRFGSLPELPPLPSAARELAEIAAAIGAQRPTILTGTAATEEALRAAKVDAGSVVAFATHGFVSGEVEGLREPALLLSAGGSDDGLLTATEIGKLDLPARWVILSACNTAAGAGPDAPGLSGLAQAFILAGADNILATHWPVRDDMARAISTGTLRAAARGLAPAQALRASLQDVRRSKIAGASHPALWAAFELVD
jgi:CHAT domain-containing protein